MITRAGKRKCSRGGGGGGNDDRSVSLDSWVGRVEVGLRSNTFFCEIISGSIKRNDAPWFPNTPAAKRKQKKVRNRQLMVLTYEDISKSAHSHVIRWLIDWLSTRICLKVCALPCYSMVDWLIEYEDMSQSLRTPMLFNGWLIDWVNVACSFFSFFVRYHLSFRLHFGFIRRMITMPIGRLELAEFGRFVSGKYRFLKCADFAAYPRARTGMSNRHLLPRVCVFMRLIFPGREQSIFSYR